MNKGTNQYRRQKWTSGLLLMILTLCAYASPIQAQCSYSEEGYIIVENTDDSGPGSLRAAIECANTDLGPDTIVFELTGQPPYTISPLSSLPSIQDSGTVIDVTLASGLSSGDLILSGENVIPESEDNPGIYIDNTDNTGIFGLEIIGWVKGIWAVNSHNLSIGKQSTGNLVYGNTNNVELIGCVDAEIQNNWIGFSPNESPNVSSEKGISLEYCSDFVIGDFAAGNKISFCLEAITLLQCNSGLIIANEIGLAQEGIEPEVADRGIRLINETSSIQIGACFSGAENIIGNVPVGIEISSGSNDNILLRNYIGSDIEETDIGCYTGIEILSSSGITLGDINDDGCQNRICHNDSGVWLFGDTQSVEMVNNYYNCNIESIFVGPSTNQEIEAPEFLFFYPDRIEGLASPGARVDIFMADNDCPELACEAQQISISVSATASNGVWSWYTPFPFDINQVTLIAQQTLNSNSSGFSACKNICAIDAGTLASAESEEDISVVLGENYVNSLGSPIPFIYQYEGSHNVEPVLETYQSFLLLADAAGNILVASNSNTIDFSLLPTEGNYSLYGLRAPLGEEIDVAILQSYSVEDLLDEVASNNLCFDLTEAPLPVAVTGPIICPSDAQVSQAEEAYCQGDPLSLSATLESYDGVSIVWRDGNGNFLSNEFDLLTNVFANSGCEETQSIHYLINCEGGIVAEDSLSFIVFGVPFAEVQIDNCTVNILPNCDDLELSWTIGDPDDPDYSGSLAYFSIDEEYNGLLTTTLTGVDQELCSFDASFSREDEIFCIPPCVIDDLMPTLSGITDNLLCPDVEHILSVDPPPAGFEVRWQRNYVDLASTQNYLLVTTSGEYRSYYIDAKECRSNFSETIKVSLFDESFVPLVLDSTICTTNAFTISQLNGLVEQNDLLTSQLVWFSDPSSTFQISDLDLFEIASEDTYELSLYAFHSCNPLSPILEMVAEIHLSVNCFPDGLDAVSESLIVFPNPSPEGKFCLKHSGQFLQFCEAEISNIYGEQFLVPIQRSQILLDGFPSGIYFARLIDDRGRKHELKLIVGQ